jgi:DNA-binding MarR family transcriptional regulator
MGDEPTSALLMFVAHRAAEARVVEAVRAAGFDDLTLAQSRIGQRLNREGIRVTDLAEKAGVTKQTAGALVDDLEANGYVTRKPDPADARARLVVLTDRGETLCATAAAEIAKVEAEWRAHLGAKAYNELRAALVSLREVTDPYR